MNILTTMSWLAIFLLPIGYWKQVWHIHKHKEVRDLNLTSYIMFAIAYLFLGIEAYTINSTLFMFKNALVIIPTCIIIYQIRSHRGDKWVDDTYEKMAERQSCPKVQHMHKRINVKSKAL